MGFTSAMVIGFFLGFVFGVGCALAVMYSIYMGGYRAAIAEMRMNPRPERFRKAAARAGGTLPGPVDERPGE